VREILDSAVSALEHVAALDGVADAVSGAARVALRSSPQLTRWLSGTHVAHPVHPALVAIPAGMWTSATVTDLFGGRVGRQAAQRLVGLGLLSAVPAAVTGASDWLDTAGAERRVGLVHAGLNYAAIGLYWDSWRQRRNGKQVRGVVTAAAGLGLLTLSGWLGAHLVYARGVGVDTTAFQVVPSEWTDTVEETQLLDGAPVLAHVNGVPIVLVRDSGEVSALLDRCTHRGGPLHEGRLCRAADRDATGTTVTCPWHGSRFRVSDGAVLDSPATRDQAVLETRILAGVVQVRRSHEAGSLRTNPVS
jgi:nitrite reductase/ring-hydroxylating ferredoxin subunit/uncharacterized membrane protein